MTETVAYGIAIASTLVAAWAGWHMYRQQPVGNPLFYAVAALELALLAMLVGGIAALSSTSRDVDGVLFVSYLISVVLIPPAAVLWGIAEKSRWGTGVVVVALLSVAVLCVRLLDIWKATYA